MNNPKRKTNAAAILARRFQLDFMEYCWINKTEPLVIGKHTRIICKKIDEAIEKYRQGISSYLIIMVPFRHGKSDIVSRYLPPRFLGLFKDAEILVASYASEFAHILSRFARSVFKSSKFKDVFPGKELSPDSASVTRWEDSEGLGSASYVGVGGAATGMGYSLGIVDDYCKNREDAESLTMRDKTWDWFTNVFMTRGAPVSITIIAATPWHVDDLIGRCRKKMDEDPNFPRFDVIKFSGESEDGFLFPERFSPEWYRTRKTILGAYGYASLLQCEPQPRGGNLLKVDMVKVVDEAPSDLRWARGWDLASTEEQTQKSDPDYTSGGLVAIKYDIQKDGERIPKIYVKDVRRFRLEAPERNRTIQQTADMDGADVRIAVECIAGYKDTYTILEDTFRGRYGIEAVVPTKDKVIRAAWIEPIIEAGNFHIVRGDWNSQFLEEMASFPGGTHDDQIDSVLTGLEIIREQDYDLGKIEVRRKDT